MSRPTKLTRAAIEIIAQAIRAGESRNDAATLANVGFSTFKGWMKEGAKAKQGLKADLYHAVRLADIEYKADLRDMIARAGRFDWRAAWQLLRHRETHAAERQEARLKVKRLKAEIRVLRQRAGDHPLSEAEATIQALQDAHVSDEETAAILAGFPVPSAAEDEAAHAAELASSPDEDEQPQRSEVIQDPDAFKTLPYDPTAEGL